jgi:anthranilate phosphoribosyltransferase
MSLKYHIEKTLCGEDLTTAEAARALELIMTDQVTEAQIAGLLISLRAKGESVDEVVGFAQTMRDHAVHIRAEDPDAIDMCGTGGDGLGTFNISTVATFVAAGTGVTVAKHGNKAVSSASGSADVLQALGVNILLAPEKVEACLNTVGVGFLFAPLFHPAMKSAAKTRKDLGTHTIFNMVGPITNPAGVKRQLIGAHHITVASRLAGALAILRTDRACVIHSENGMDEVSLSGNTSVVEVIEERIRTYSVGPEQFGLRNLNGASMRGGDSMENAKGAIRILEGEKSPHRDVVVANAAFGIYVAGKAATLADGTLMAEDSIDSGRACDVLRNLIDFSRRT